MQDLDALLIERSPDFLVILDAEMRVVRASAGLRSAVPLVAAGEDKNSAGEACDVLKLSFANVGLTPKDLYWLCVDKKSHLVTQWKYVLDGANKPPTTYTWSDWKKVGSIMLSATRTAVGKPSVIRFESLAVSDKPDEAALTPPK